jgi:hypothetical protein
MRADRAGSRTFADPGVLAATHGYHPLVADASAMLATGLFVDVLVLGAELPDPAGAVERIRQIVEPTVSLPEGVFWFSGPDPARLLVVTSGSVPGPGAREPADQVSDDSPVALALGWFEHLWEMSTEVPLPRFAVTEEVITRAGRTA